MKTTLFFSDVSFVGAEGKANLETVPAEEIPEILRKMSGSERKTYIGSKAKERAELQQRTAQLDGQQFRFLATAARPITAPTHSIRRSRALFGTRV